MSLFFSSSIFFLVIFIYTKINPSAVQNPNFILYRLGNWIGVISKYMPANILRSRMDRPMDRPALLIIGNLEIYPNDFPSAMEWTYAKEACEALGDGWRLPTIEELLFLRNQEDNDLCWDFYYWSSTEFDCDHALVVYYENCTQLNKICNKDISCSSSLKKTMNNLFCGKDGNIEHTLQYNLSKSHFSCFLS